MTSKSFIARTADGRVFSGGARTVVSSAARTATGNSGAVGLLHASASRLNLLVDVTAVTGTSPTMDLTIKWSHDGSTFGGADGTADTFAQITATGAVSKQFTVKAPHYRVEWTLGGTTPSFTFSVSEQADD